MIRPVRITISFILLWGAFSLIAPGRDVRNDFAENIRRYGGSSAPYEYLDEGSHAAPRGFKPFYISHFGRHGSRYHTTAELCPSLVSLMKEGDERGILTDEGEDLYRRLTAIDEATRDKAGDLTRVGMDEHEAIASRMFDSYKRVLSGKGKHILAQATTSPRVILSMSSFCNSLKLRNPDLDIFCEAGSSTSRYLNHYTKEYKEYFSDGPWREVRDKWTKDNLQTKDLISRLFQSPDLFGGNPSGHKAGKFAKDLYSLAKIMPATGLGISLYDFFSDDELYVLWQAGNMDQYMRKGPSPLSGGLALDIAKPLLKDFISKADDAVAGKGRAADLRFGHGEGLMPLAGLMGIEEASGVCSAPDSIGVTWQDYRVTTMGANIQWIFYRNKAGKVLVKILLNEREARIPVATHEWPYYAWEDIRAYYSKILGN